MNTWGDITAEMWSRRRNDGEENEGNWVGAGRRKWKGRKDHWGIKGNICGGFTLK